MILAILIGLLAGAHVSTWGMYKDSIHEGFTYGKYFRSIMVGGLVGAALQLLLRFDLTDAGSVVVFFGLVYAGERGVVEVWKTFIRTEDQAKYTIPMQFNLRGRFLKSRAARWLLGVSYVGAVVLVLGAIAALDRARPDGPQLLLVLAVGSIGGWISAFGGAWKDAPVEGFEILKFFRSPAITAAWAVVLALMTDSYLFMAVAALGYERATIETWKTFFFPSRPRGKFAGKPILHPHMLERRQRFVPLYVVIWLMVIAAWAAAFTQPFEGILGR